MRDFFDVFRIESERLEASRLREPSANIISSATGQREKIAQYPSAAELVSRWTELEAFSSNIIEGRSPLPLVSDAKVLDISWVEIEFLYPYFRDDRRATELLRSAQGCPPIDSSVKVELVDVETVRTSMNHLHVSRSLRLEEVSMEDALKAKCLASSPRLVGVFGNVGIGKTHLCRRLVGDHPVYIPIRFADHGEALVRCPSSELAVQQLADSVIRRCFPQHCTRSLARPTELLKQYLRTRQSLTLILDPVDDALKALPSLVTFIKQILSLRSISMVMSSRFDFLVHPLVREIETEFGNGVIEKLPILGFTLDEAKDFLT